MSVSEYGKMISSVSRLSGICGIRKNGRLSGNSPMSATVRMSRFMKMAKAVSTTMVTSGEGMALVM
eukprot:3252-Eustigmatos_ZCMA.PRE.1